ncbi:MULTISPECIES: M15 family metallopeptidase [Exiguobacterium]|uniref:M15 family metallopeptidase n=1 Tax=Exiguobacterium TaxID=33986 RepID=UPI001AE6753A|nr:MULTISPECIES: M15 family metallopeptidase [Exiguobacterium]MCT4781388.1 M15 family metallopeptidase [Exiguobacterium soli]
MTPSLDWLLEQADRKLAKEMDPDVVAITRSVITELAAEGLPIGIAQAFRTRQEQDALYAIGRTRPGKIVTYAKGGASNHNFGVAVDLFLYADGGKRAEFLAPPDPRLQRLVRAMKQYQMQWGGDWGNFPDYPHFQLYDAVNKQPKPLLGPRYPGRPLHPAATWMDGTVIRLIQKRLRLPLTGRFDTTLTRVVKQFQQRHHLQADGVIGPVTWRHLFGADR